MEKIKVLLITGFSRSGSTVLGRLLGQQQGVFFGGELHSVWKRNVEDNELCGCGQSFKRCSTWNAIFTRAFGGISAVDVNRILSAQSATTRMRHWTSNAWPGLRSRKRADAMRLYSDSVRTLFKAIAEETGCRMIVDTSKNPSYGLYLATIPEIDLHVIHLVRDCRAVIHSWQRKRRMHDVHWAEQDMEQFSWPWTTFFWTATNLLTDINSLFMKKFAFLRYEDFAKNPGEVLPRIFKFTGNDESRLGNLDGASFPLKTPEHSLGGNPSRFDRNDIRVLPDEEWRSLRKGRNLFIAFLVWPLMLRYVWTRKLTRSGLASQRRK